MRPAAVRKRGAPIIPWVLERLAHKSCPQGLHVMLEELLWMGVGPLTYDQLCAAVRTELRRPWPRIKRVTQNVYWFADRDIPRGWSLYCDQRMLPCFYRVYPPAISWDDLDRPENILPPPGPEYAAPTAPPRLAPPVLSRGLLRRRFGQPQRFA